MNTIIEFTGIDCSGKTSVISELKNYLESIGKSVLVKKFPSSGKFGVEARRLINAGVLGESFATALRRDLIQIYNFKEKNKEHDFILLDRGLTSYVAYQRELLGKPVEMPLIKGFIDAVVMLDVKVEDAIERMKSRSSGADPIESLGKEFFDNVRINLKEALHAVTKSNVLTFRVCASRDLDLVVADSKKIISRFINENHEEKANAT